MKMAGRYHSKLSGFNFLEFIPHCGNPDKTYEIILPNPNHSGWPTHRVSSALWALMPYLKNIRCIMDHDAICQRMPPAIKIFNSNPSSFFLINDHLFMLIDWDRPIDSHERWIPHYQKYVTAFFVANMRHSTNFIFDNCTVPVFPLPPTHDCRVPLHYYEHFAHSQSLTVTKDISVFFHGRGLIRVARKHAGKLISDHFPDSCIEFCEHTALSGSEYVDKLSRAKIAWCPRTAWSPPDHEVNTITSRELDAMCLEVLVLKHGIDIVEVAKRPANSYVQMKNDSSDMIEKIAYYLEHEDERKEIAKNGRLFWELNYSVTGRAFFLLKSCLKAMEEPDSIEQIRTGAENN
jgi:hypothetical protein